MTLCVMTIADYDDMSALWNATPGMGLRSLDDTRAGLDKYLRRNPTTSFVARDENGRLLGLIMAGHDGRRGTIHHTAVAPESRGQGVGRALAEAAQKALRSEGINKVNLVAFATNDLGNGFWEAMGFTTRPDLVYRNKSLNPDNT